MSALLAVRDLRVEFATRKGPLVALDGVSFEIAPGEVLGVVGESGAGKSLTGVCISQRRHSAMSALTTIGPPLRIKICG